MKTLKLFMAAGLAAALSFATAAQAQETTPIDGNYAIALQAAQNIQVAQALAMKAKADGLPAALQACARFTGELAQGLCALAATGVIGSAGGQQLAVATGATIPVPPAPQKAAASIYELLANAPSALFEGAVKIAPAVVQYMLGRVQAESNTKIAIAGSQERVALYNTMGTMHGQAVNGLTQLGTQGFITIGSLPPTYNVTGTGNNFGAGPLTFNPVTGSYNPVNPAPRVCSSTPAGVSCQ